jgi:hypothetical protein
MQIALMRELRLRYPSELFFAIPNGGFRTWRTGRRLRLEGCKPGIPDICCPKPCGRWASLWLELKQPGNKPSDDQVEVMELLRRNRACAIWCNSYEDALDACEKYLHGVL